MIEDRDDTTTLEYKRSSEQGASEDTRIMIPGKGDEDDDYSSNFRNTS